MRGVSGDPTKKEIKPFFYASVGCLCVGLIVPWLFGLAFLPTLIFGGLLRDPSLREG